MTESHEPGDCCPISDPSAIEEKGVSFGPRQVRPDSFDAYSDKESARARARQLGCIGIRQYNSTTGGTVWMPCGTESDYRRVTGASPLGRRQRRRMLEAELGLDSRKKALGPTIGAIRRDMDPFTAIDADLDRIVLEGIPQINLGRGVPDPTPFDAPKAPKMREPKAVERAVTEPPSPDTPQIPVPMPSRRTRVRRREVERLAPSPSEVSRDERDAKLVEKKRTLSDLNKISDRARKATGTSRAMRAEPARRPSVDSVAMAKDRLDLAGVPDSLLKASTTSGKLAPLTQKDKRAAGLISSGGTDGAGALNATMLYKSLKSQDFLRNFVASEESNISKELSSLLREGRLPSLAKAILGMSPEEVENFTGIKPRQLILSARSARQNVRAGGSWLASIDNDPFETASHMLRMKDYHLSALANGVGNDELNNAVDELVGGTVNEARANFASLISRNKPKLNEAYDGAIDLAETGNKLFSVAREVIADANENDVSWSSTRTAILNAVENALSGTEPSAAMTAPVIRYGRNYPRSRRKSGDWSPIANKIRDRIGAYKRRYGAPAANSADLEMFVDYEYPELLDEAAELIDLFKEKVEYGSLAMSEYADGWIDRERGELDIHTFDAANLETIFDPKNKMGLFKTIAVVLSAASTKAPSDYEADGVMTMLDELYEWGEFALPVYTVPRVFSQRKRNIFPEVGEPTGAMTVNRPVPDDVRRIVQGVDRTPLIGDEEEPMRRMRAAIVAAGNRMFENVDRQDIGELVSRDPMGPAMRIADTFLTVADQFDMDQQSAALLFERVGEEMASMLRDIPSANKRQKVSDMFKDALSYVLDEVDDGNERFFQIVGSPPSQTLGRLSRRISSSRSFADEPTASISINPGRPQAGYAKIINPGTTQKGESPAIKARWQAIDEASEILWEALEDTNVRNVNKTLKQIGESLNPDQIAEIAQNIVQTIQTNINRMKKEVKSAKNNRLSFDPRKDWTRKIMAGLTIAMYQGVLKNTDARQLMLPRQREYSPSGSGNDKFINKSKIRRILRNSFGITVYKGEELAAWSETLLDDQLGVMHGSTRSEEETAANFLGSILNQFIEGPESWTLNDGKGNSNTQGDEFNESFERYIRNPLNTVLLSNGQYVGVQLGTGFDKSKQLMLMRKDIQRLYDTIIAETGTPIFEFVTQPWIDPSIYDAQKGPMGLIVDTLASQNPTHQDSRKSFVEKFVVATADVYFMDEIQKQAMALELGRERMSREAFAPTHTPLSGNNENALLDMQAIIDDIFQALDNPTDSATAAKRVAAQYSSMEAFMLDLRSLGLKKASEPMDKQLAQDVLNGQYVTNDAVRALIDDKYPGFEQRFAAVVGSDEVTASMAGPDDKPWSTSLAEIRERVVRRRELLELGRVASIEERRDDLMKLAAARRKILLELAEPNGILQIISRGVTNERDPLSLGRIAKSPDALAGVLSEFQDGIINGIYSALIDRLAPIYEPGAPSIDSELKSKYPPIDPNQPFAEQIIAAQNADPEEIRRKAIKRLKKELFTAATVIALDSGWRPEDPNPTESEVLAAAGFSSFQDMLPEDWPPVITQSDLDMVPSTAAKARAAIEMLAIDRRQLIELLSSPTTLESARQAVAEEIEPNSEIARRTISARPAKIDWVPTADHMDQLAVIDAVSPLDKDSLTNAVAVLTEAQLARLESLPITTAAGQKAYDKEMATTTFSSLLRKLFGYAEIHSVIPDEKQALRKRIDLLEAETSLNPSITALANAVYSGDEAVATEIMKNIADNATGIQDDVMRLLWIFGSDSTNRSIMSLLPAAIDDATKDSLRRFRAATVALEQPDGGKKLLRETIDAAPSDGEGYVPVRVVTETDTERRAMSLSEAIRAYDGTAETAKAIIESLNDGQLERLRRNYIIPSIIQRMDRKAYEERLASSAQAQLAARLDNLAVRLAKSEINGETMDNLVAMIDDALSQAFGDRYSDMSLLNPEEKKLYGDIVDYFVTGGREILDPSRYAEETAKMARENAEYAVGGDGGSGFGPDAIGRLMRDARTHEALRDFDIYQGEQVDTDDPDDGDMWSIFGIDPTASMAVVLPPTPSDDDRNTIEALSTEDATTIFGEDIKNYIVSGRYTPDVNWPITSDAKNAVKARLIIDSLYNAARGRMPELVASRLRNSGQYAKATEVFEDIVTATGRILRKAGFEIPVGFDPTDYDAEEVKNSLFIDFGLFFATMQEYVAIHMALGASLPIPRYSSGADRLIDSDESFTEEHDLQMSDFKVLKNGKLVYYPAPTDGGQLVDGDDETIEQTPREEEFTGDPATHPIVQQIDSTIRNVKRSFGNFDDWLDQANRYSRILGSDHYEKNEKQFGPGIIDQVQADPSSLSLDRVIRAVVDMFPSEVSDRSIEKAAYGLPPDPDDQPGFPSLSSYPNPDVINRVLVSEDRKSKQKKIATSTAKSSVAARGKWWSMLTTGTLMDPYEIAALEKTSDGDNFHPDAIIAGIRKYARENNLSSTALRDALDAAEDAARRRFNESAIRRITAMIVDINKNNRNGVAGELFELDQQLRQLENQRKELSRFYQDRIRARTQTLTSAVAVMSSGFNAERRRLMSELQAGRMSPQQVVDAIRAAYVAIQPAMLSAMNQTADLSRMAEASRRSVMAVESQMSEVRRRVDELKEAVQMSTSEIASRMEQIRGVSNGLNMLRNDPSGLADDDTTASMSIGSVRYPIIGSNPQPARPKRTLLSSVEQRVAERIVSLNKMRSENNIEDIRAVPDMRTAMLAIRNSGVEDILPTIDMSTPRAMERSLDAAKVVTAADIASEAFVRRTMGDRFMRFSDIALNTLPSLTKRIATDALEDGFASAMDANLVSEADVESAIAMLRANSVNVRNAALYSSPAMAAQMLGVDQTDVEDAIATETLMTRSRGLLRSAYSFASRISDSYSSQSVYKMTMNRFPQLAEFGEDMASLIVPTSETMSVADSSINEAIGLNRQMPMTSDNIATAFGFSDDIAKVIAATGRRRKRARNLSSSLPSDWNFMTFRDRQRWLMSESATNSLGQMGVTNELAKLQKQIEDFGSLDGPYPALARAISGNGMTTGLFGSEIVDDNGTSPLFSSNGLRAGDVVRGSAYQFSSLADVVPAIYDMSDAALSRFLNASQETIGELRREGGGLSRSGAKRVAEAFNRTVEGVWPEMETPTDMDAGNFYWLANTWGRSGEAIRMLSEGMDEQSIAEAIGVNGQFIARKVNELINDGTVDRFYDAIGEELVDEQTALDFAMRNAPRSRKDIVGLLARSGYGEPEIVDATGINANTVRNSLHELRKSGALPDVVGSPQWISQNSEAIVNDYSSGMSKRSLMRKYGIGAQNLESILSSESDNYVPNAYEDGPTASMANKRIKDDSVVRAEPVENWQEKLAKTGMADGSALPEGSKPPAYVANPFNGIVQEATLGVGGSPKNENKTAKWRDAISDWLSVMLEGGYFSRKDLNQAEQILGVLFGDIGSNGYDAIDIPIAGDPNDPNSLVLSGKDFKTFEIATRKENPASPLFMVSTIPSSASKEFNATGVYRGVLPTLRTMLLGAYDRYFRNPEDGMVLADAAREGVSTSDLIEAGLLDEPEIPADMDDDLRLKLWQLRTMLRNPNVATAAPLFEAGDEKAMARLIPIMASIDERNQLRARYGAGASSVLGDPSEDLDFAVSGMPMFMNIGPVSDFMPGEPMFIQLLLSGAVQGDNIARSVLDDLTPRQMVLANWVYGMYTMTKPLIDTFGEMMPTNVMSLTPVNIPDEPGSQRMPGERYPLPVREMDDQVFAFAFDSVFKGLKQVITKPMNLVSESLPAEELDRMSGSSPMDSQNMRRLAESARVSAQIMSDMIATALYRRAVQSTAIDEYSTPFYTGEDSNTGWLKYARPRVDALGFWSMYGPNVVYAAPGLPTVYKPGWNDSLSKFVGEIPERTDLTQAEVDMLEKMDELIADTPGRYWWETAGAYGRLTDSSILAMSPEEFAQYASDMSMFSEMDEQPETPSALLNKVINDLSVLGWPEADVSKWDEWLGSIVKAMPEGKASIPAILNQLKNIFPYLDITRNDDIYPVVGKSFAESMAELSEMIDGLPFTVLTEAAERKPQVAVALTNRQRELATTDAIAQLAMVVLSEHRTNQNLGYRKLSSFARILSAITNGPRDISERFSSELMAMGKLLEELESTKQINQMTSLKLREALMSAMVGNYFGDVGVGEAVLESMGQDRFTEMIGGVIGGMEGELDAETIMKMQGFYDSFQRLSEEARQSLGDEYEGYVNSGIFGSVKTIGDAIAEVSPFIAAQEKVRERRRLLSRYKREVIDPIADQLLTDAERLRTLQTFEEWLGSNGYGGLTWSNAGDGPTASMSALTRMAMSRFTNDAVATIINGYDDAVAGKTKTLNNAHLMLGAWRIVSANKTGAVAQALRKLNVSVEAMQNALLTALNAADGEESDTIVGFSKHAALAMRNAILAASRRGMEFVDMGDLISALVDPNLHDGKDDNLGNLLSQAGISPYQIMAAIGSARVTGDLGPTASMSSGRAILNTADKKAEKLRSKSSAERHWFNADRPESLSSGFASDAELVDEVSRLMNLYADSVDAKKISPWDWRNGETPLSYTAFRPTNSMLIYGDLGQEASDLVGAINQAIRKADALVVDPRERRRMENLLSDMQLYFGNDEHITSYEELEPTGAMSGDFESMMEPIRDLYSRNPQLSQKLYYSGIYGDPKSAREELVKAANIESIRSPFDIRKNLGTGTEEDVNWSTNDWTYNKDGLFIQAADSVILRIGEDGDIRSAQVAMISRKSGPYTDALALVGGLRDGEEDLMTTATRETMEEVGVDLNNTIQAQYLGTIESPDWDPRFVNGARVGAGMFVVPWDTELNAASDARAAKWVPLSEIVAGQHEIAFGHAEWLRRAVAMMNVNRATDPTGDLRLSIATRLSLLAKASRVRNQDLIARINLVRQAADKKLFPSTNDMPHPMMPWGTKVAKSVWSFGEDGPTASMGPGDSQIDDSLPRELGLMDVQSTMSASALSNGARTDAHYSLGYSRTGDPFDAWGDKDRVENLWRPYVDRSLAKAIEGSKGRPESQPTVYVLGGATATGKSSARNAGLNGIPNYDTAMVADPDDAKIVMPEARLWFSNRIKEAAGFVHQESRAAAAIMARVATENGVDLVYDTSGQFNDGYQDLTDWRNKGYKTVAHYFFAPLETLYKRNEERFRRTGRWVMPGIISTIQSNLSDLLPNLMSGGYFDEVYIYDSERDPMRPTVVGRMQQGATGLELAVLDPRLFRYIFQDRVDQFGKPIDVRKTKIIPIRR